MLLSLVGFTGMALLIKHLGATRGVSPWLALFFRAAVGMAVVVIVFAPSGRVQFKRALFSRLLVTRGALGAIGTAAYYLTLPVLGAGKATLIGNTWVIWSAILAVFMLGEDLSLRKLFGTVLAIAGIVFLMGLQGGDFTHLGRYEALAITGALVAAGVVVVIRQLTLTETSGTIFASQCAYTALLALPFIVRLPMPSLTDLGLLTSAALLAALGQLAMTEGFRYLPVSTGGAFQILLPLTITVAGVLLFDEAFTAVQVGGAVLILSGCYQTVTAKAAPASSRPAREGGGQGKG
jgi:drug/metabolite transporter (DMT)-like permease